MKIAKRILERSADPWLALLEWRNTPTVGMGSTPCQRLFSQRTRSVVPVKETQLEPVPQINIQERKWQRQRCSEAESVKRARSTTIEGGAAGSNARSEGTTD